MMTKKLSNKDPDYQINLAAIDGDGTFPCPKCRASISPDDESEENYHIVDTKVVNEKLAELVISCKKCRSVIKLTGFEAGFDA
jgi:hypothetical protein